jgi:hypothetical protein
MDYLIDIDNYRGTGRLYLPSAWQLRALALPQRPRRGK